MIDHDDVRFSSFTRDLARRHRRPRSYPPPPPSPADALEQLCGGGVVALPGDSTPPPSLATLARWADDSSDFDMPV